MPESLLVSRIVATAHGGQLPHFLGTSFLEGGLCAIVVIAVVVLGVIVSIRVAVVALKIVFVITAVVADTLMVIPYSATNEFVAHITVRQIECPANVVFHVEDSPPSNESTTQDLNFCGSTLFARVM